MDHPAAAQVIEQCRDVDRLEFLAVIEHQDKRIVIGLDVLDPLARNQFATRKAQSASDQKAQRPTRALMQRRFPNAFQGKGPSNGMNIHIQAFFTAWAAQS